MNDEEQICRVCRSEGTVDNPLFYPCKCSGSIRYIHEDCLTEWLRHSRKRFCELCNHKFSFTPVYHPNMPESLPFHLLVKRFIYRTVTFSNIWSRLHLVLFTWVVAIPYSVLWFTRVCYWVSDNINESLIGNPKYMFLTRNQALVDELNHSAFSTLKRHFVMDIVEGEVVSILIAVLVGGGLLLREWLAQNMDLAAELDVDIERRQNDQELPNIVQEMNNMAHMDPQDINIGTQNTHFMGEELPPEASPSDYTSESININDINGVMKNSESNERQPVASTSTAKGDVGRLSPWELNMYISEEAPNSSIEGTSPVTVSDSPEKAPSPKHPSEIPINLDRPRSVSIASLLSQDGLSQYDLDVIDGIRTYGPEQDTQLPIAPITQEASFDDTESYISETEDEEINVNLDEFRRPAQVDAEEEDEDGPGILHQLMQWFMNNINEEEVAEEEGEEEPNNGGANVRVAEEVNAIMEVIGMEGPMKNLFTNAIMVEMFLTIGFFMFIFFPYYLGKLVLSNHIWEYLPVAFSWAQSQLSIHNILPLNNSEVVEIARYWWISLNELLTQNISPTFSLEPLISIISWDKIRSIAESPSSWERVWATLVGYSFAVTGSGAVHLFTSNTAMLNVTSLFLMEMKVIFFVLVELLIFPIFTGVLLDLCTLPIFGLSYTNRIQFHNDAPIISVFLHWFSGSMLMSHIAAFIAVCRGIYRPGLLWFIRDPNDMNFNPMKEIMEKPLSAHARRLIVSAIMYTIFVLCGIGYNVLVIKVVFSSLKILPLNLSPSLVNTVPVDLLAFHLVFPWMINLTKPKELFRNALDEWTRVVCRYLRLTSFIYGRRHRREEFKFSTWLPEPLYRKMYGKAPNRVKDGGLYRAPNYDIIPVIPGQKMITPLTPEQTKILESGFYAAKVKHLISEDGKWAVVYLPSHYLKRVIVLMAMIWQYCALVIVTFFTVSVFLGRLLFSIVFNGPVHDMYSIMLGGFISWTIFIALIKGNVFMQLYSYFGLAVMDKEEPSPLSRLWNKERILCSLKTVMKAIYFFVFFGLLLPTLLTSVVKAYIFNPIRYLSSGICPISFFSQDWAIGLIYAKSFYEMGVFTRILPIQNFIGELDWFKLGEVDIAHVTKILLLPAVGGFIVAIYLPYLLGIMLSLSLGMEDTLAIERLCHYCYPVCLVIVLYVLFQEWFTKMFRRWTNTVRNDEYLIGRTLHNLGPRQPQDHAPGIIGERSE